MRRSNVLQDVWSRCYPPRKNLSSFFWNFFRNIARRQADSPDSRVPFAKLHLECRVTEADPSVRALSMAEAVNCHESAFHATCTRTWDEGQTPETVEAHRKFASRDLRPPGAARAAFAVAITPGTARAFAAANALRGYPVSERPAAFYLMGLTLFRISPSALSCFLVPSGEPQ